MNKANFAHIENSRWVSCKQAAGMVGISPRRFRETWVPEDGPAQVTYRNANGKTGRYRRIEVDLFDLQEVLESRTTKRIR